MDLLSVDRDFNMLSLPDLLEARDLYHLHLTHKENVIATAVGRYLIRRSDPWPSAENRGGLTKADTSKAAIPKPARTLANSEVRPYSWPCVLVFVDQWVQEDKFGAPHTKFHADDMVPRALYLPDGRVVPVCVVEATRQEIQPLVTGDLTYPEVLIGGGYPVIADVQEQEHVASIGCLVTDGHLVYALTNRHVSGAPGEVIYAMLGGEKVRIGVSSGRQLTRLPFEKVYPEWPGKKVYVNLDIGLIKIDDKNQWTAQVYGIGQMGKMADLSGENISLRLIGCPVRAYGCASKQMQGAIHALYYRFKSIGGFEYVSDFLIGPRKGDDSFSTQPGDSGTLWLLETDDPKTGLMPMAVQWGGDVFVDGNGTGQRSYALATCLSTVCNLLDVDVIRDWNIGVQDYWGAVGHYTIANQACSVIQNPKLKELMTANLETITFETADITDKSLSGLSKRPFVPLADVPDLVWKIGTFNRGQPEHPNHFADMDKPRPGDKATLLDICKGHPDNVAVDVWLKYYADVKDDSKGLLPFRVWQFYQEMVDFVAKGQITEFVTAAGILSHYVGDACQPLHISFMFNGDPDHPVPTSIKDPKTHAMVTKSLPLGTGVHAAYEDDMVNFHISGPKGIQQGVAKAIKPLGTTVKGGHGAAVAVVALMQKTFDTISPGDIVKAFVAAEAGKPKEIADALWTKFGNKTITVITEGSRCLAMLWDSAWAEGIARRGKDDLTALGPVAQNAVIKLYQDRTFLQSFTLDKIKPHLR